MFAATVARFGGRTAVEVLRGDRVETFTYQQLHDMAAAWAAWLSAQGIGAGDRCALLAHNDAHWCAAYLGTLKRGAVAVPLDTNYSAAQVATIVADSGARLVFVSDVLKDSVPRAGIAVANLHQVPGLEPAVTDPATDSRTPAVILYTSGTTSDPKGVVLTHGNLMAERNAAFAVVDVSDKDAVLGVLPLSHSLAQLANLLLPFAVGARVVYLETLNSADLISALARRRITIFASVPPFFYLIHQRVTAQVAKSGPVARIAFKVMLALNFRLRRIGINAGRVFFGKVHDALGRDMRLFVTGGSKFDHTIGRDLYSLGFTILQAYGLTETSAAATITTADDAHLDTVGRPLPGVEVKLVDGEIAIRGPIVMREYHNRPDATAEAIRDGWFFTGDLGRLDDAGRITITGRKKDTIVLASGKNIYPEEIEAHYRQSAFIKEVCVLGLAEPDRLSSERLFAVVVPDMERLREKQIVNAGDLIRFEMEGLAVGLPSHKRVLRYEIWFKPLPRTTTQKIKRHEVERIVRERHLATASSEPALDRAELDWSERVEVAPVLAAIAARAKVGARLRPDANLELDLGFDSMQRVELLTELEQTFGIKVPGAVTREIFTVRQLVDAVRAERRSAPASGSPGLAPWPAIFKNLPLPNDPVLRGILADRPIAAPLIFSIGRLAHWLVMPRTVVHGLKHLPASGPYLICPNHQSFLDPIFVCNILPFRIYRQLFFVGAVEYFETAFTRWVAAKINLVPVDPDSNLIPAMQAGACGLSHGKILVLFPEGERAIDGTVRNFKKGAPILAQHLHVPIVPCALKGVFEVWPRNRPLDWKAFLPFSGHRVRIAFGPPMLFDEDANYAASAARLRGAVDELWQQL